MKKNLWIILILLAVSCIPVTAQSRGSYFFDNSLLRSKLNPAFAPRTNYASFPVAGSFNVDMVSNVGLKNFIFPAGDANSLYLNEAVPAETFLSGLPRRDPYLQERLESDLFGFGMKMGRDGYATLSLSLVEDGQISLTNDLLRFTKTGSSSQQFFAGGFAEMAGYAALAAGYSHDMSSLLEGLHVGARVKLLFGLAAGHMSIDRMGMQSDQDQLSASLHGTGAISGIEYLSADGISLSRLGLRGFGAAIDLGASYWLPIEGPLTLSGVELSASICDLGGLSYRNNVSSLMLNHELSFSGVTDFTGDMDAGFKELFRDLNTFTQMESSEGAPFAYNLPVSIHAGATARLWQDKANVGLLYYHTLRHSNLMLAGGISPVQWLNLGINWTFLGPANRVGFFAEFIPKKYMGLFLGMERASLRSNSSHIPVRNFSQSISFGLNVLFGE